MKTAVVYARVSEARNSEDGLPLESQVEQCLKKAESLEASVINTYVDNGISGTTDARPAFKEAFLFCELKRPDYFITWSPERFARNKMHAALYKEKLCEFGVKLVYVAMDIDTGTLGGWFLDGILDVVNQYQALKVSVDVRRSMMKVARDGFWTGGRPPFGYRVVPAGNGTSRKKMVPDEAEADVVREIFRLKTSDHLGCRSIATMLNEKGLLNRGRPWCKSTISYILNHRAMIGEVAYGKRETTTGKRKPLDECIIIKSHEPIISQELWHQAHAALQVDRANTDTSRATSRFLFTGLMMCSCGSSMQTESASGRNRRYWYYNCRAAAERKLHAPRRIAAKDFDHWLLNSICDQLITERTLDGFIQEVEEAAAAWVSDNTRRRNIVLRQISAIEHKINNLYAILEETGAGTPNILDLTPRLRSHRHALGALEDQLKRIDAELPPAIDVQKLNPDALRKMVMKEFASSSVRKIRAFLKTFISGVTVLDDEVRIQYNAAALLGGGGGSPDVQHGPPDTLSKNRLKCLILQLPDWARKAA